MRRLLALACAATATVAPACGGGVASYGPNKVDIPATDGARAGKNAGGEPSRQGPPPSGAAREPPFPAVTRVKLANGMNLAVITSRGLPIVQLRAHVEAGTGYGATPAVATLTGSMLESGATRGMSSAERRRRIETLGAELTVSTTFDSTVVALPLTSDRLAEGMAILAEVVREPRFEEDELRKVRARALDHAEEAARAGGAWSAKQTLFRELFPERSAYATYSPLPSHIARADVAALRDFHRRFYVPKATTLVMAGDVDEATARALAERHFGAWTGGEPPRVEHAPPPPLTRTRVVVAHRPRSVQSEIYVAMLAPPRHDERWPAVRVASQVLGGGAASRLFTDVREPRALAEATEAGVFELPHNALPIFVRATTETSKTSRVLVALMDNVTRMASSPPAPSEVQNAGRYASNVFALRSETTGAIADLVVTQEEFGFPDGYWDAYRKQLRAVDPSQVEAAAKNSYTVDKALVVVAGDADVVATELARFGDVTVVDPEKEFKTMRTLPQVTK